MKIIAPMSRSSPNSVTTFCLIHHWENAGKTGLFVRKFFRKMILRAFGSLPTGLFARKFSHSNNCRQRFAELRGVKLPLLRYLISI